MSDDAWLENDLGGLECGCAVRIVWGIATALRCVSLRRLGVCLLLMSLLVCMGLLMSDDARALAGCSSVCVRCE